MGAEQPKPQNPSCEVFISLNQSIFFPGDKIKGAIILNPKKNMHISKLLLSITQAECWKYQQGKKKESNVTLAEESIDVSAEIHPGKARFSFAFFLPKFTIPSFEYPCTDFNAYIRTYFNVTLTEIQDTVKQIILIKKPETIINCPSTQQIITIPTVMFVDQGPIVITVSYPSNCFEFFQNIPLNLSIDSTKSHKSVKQYKIFFIRKIKLLNQGKEEKNMFIEDVLYQVKRPVTQKMYNFSEIIEVSEPEIIYNKYLYNSEGISFPDKKQLINFMPSTSTGFISCEYYIKFVGYYEKLFGLQKTKKIIMPVSICHSAEGNKINKENKEGESLESKFNKENNHESIINNSSVLFNPYPPFENSHELENDNQNININELNSNHINNINQIDHNVNNFNQELDAPPLDSKKTSPDD